jgi:circadian clock protein KaiB
MAKPNNDNQQSNGEGLLRTRLRKTSEAFEDALKVRALRGAKYILRLYVTGSSSRSLKAVQNLKRICEEYLPDDYDLEVIDIYKNPAVAREEQIIAAPTLVKKLPKPLRKFVGDLSNTQKVLVGLDVYKRDDDGEELSSVHP